MKCVSPVPIFDHIQKLLVVDILCKFDNVAGCDEFLIVKDSVSDLLFPKGKEHVTSFMEVTEWNCINEFSSKLFRVQEQVTVMSVKDRKESWLHHNSLA